MVHTWLASKSSLFTPSLQACNSQVHSSLQYVLLHARREALRGRWASAYKALDKVGLGCTKPLQLASGFVLKWLMITLASE
jgi:hypothetical protein